MCLKFWNAGYDDCTNFWNSSYPSGGNYWDDFDEPGEGAYDNNSDGIVDDPYDIPGGSNQDHYPLMNLWVSGDLDHDGDVDQSDLGILLADWGCTGGDCPGDINGDGNTDQSDLGILLANWGYGT